MSAKILVVDDEQSICKLINRYLNGTRFECSFCNNSELAMQMLSENSFDLLLTDLAMPGTSGIELIRHAKELYPYMGRVVMTGKGTPDEAIECLDLGVYSYILKPFTENYLHISLENALRHSLLNNELKHYKQILEKNISQRTEKLNAIWDNLSAGIVMINRDMTIVELNQKMQQWFPNVELKGIKLCYQIFSDPAQQDICEECPIEFSFRSGKRHEVMRRVKTAEGTKDFRIVTTPIHNNSGEIYAGIALYDDMTERVALERDLRQAQKLESVGQLAAGIAHEINTPIQYIGDNINFLKDAAVSTGKLLQTYDRLWQHLYDDGLIPENINKEITQAKEESDLEYLMEEIPKTVEESLAGVSRVNKIVRAMKDFSHPGDEDKTSADINKIIESTTTVCRNEWKYVANLKTELAPDLPPVRCYPGDIGQVFLNIIVNAAHAIEKSKNSNDPQMGLITIETEKSPSGIMIRISDTGGGIPQKIQEKVFDPFFTTKPRGKGTGQGLAIAHRVIVERHNGKLYFETTDGVGTTFFINLPIN